MKEFNLEKNRNIYKYKLQSYSTIISISDEIWQPIILEN